MITGCGMKEQIREKNLRIEGDEHKLSGNQKRIRGVICGGRAEVKKSTRILIKIFKLTDKLRT